MSTERRLLLAIVLCVIAIAAMEWIYPAPRPGPPRPAAGTGARIDAPPATGSSGPSAAPPAEGGVPVPEIPDAGGRVPVVDPPPFEPLAFSSGRLRATVRSRGGGIDGLTLAGVLAAPGGRPEDPAAWLRFLEPSPGGQPPAFAVNLLSRDCILRDLERVDWRLASAPGALPVVLETRALPRERDGLGLIVTVTLEPAADADAWHLLQTVRVRNEDPDLAGQELRVQVRGAALLRRPPAGGIDRLVGWAKARNTGLKITDGTSVAAGAREREPVRHAGNIEWAGSGSEYFAALVAPVVADPAEPSPVTEVQWSALVPPADRAQAPPPPQASPLLMVQARIPPPGTDLVHRFLVFVGPKSSEVLDREEYANLRSVQDHGMFAFIAVPLFVILSAFHHVVPNWGVAIILLTLLVRGLLFPLSKRQLKSTIEYGEKMKRFKPKLDALKERYKNNPKKVQQEQLLLMKQEGIPLMPGGCLLTFLQIPIWIALYGMLQRNFSLRHAPFLWVDDLSQADHLVRLFDDVGSIPWFLPNAVQYLNLLPLIMTFTWFFASKATMTPPADEQQAQMQKMMQWMPFIMLLFPGFYTMPAGLCLYITVSSLWGIVESRYIRKSLGVA